MSEEQKGIKPEEKPEVPSSVDGEAKASDVKKGEAMMSKRTEAQNPGECAGCAKPISKRLWHYKSGAFYCNKKCHKRKLEADKKKAEESAKK